MKKKISILLFLATGVLIFISATIETQSPCDSPVVGDHSGAPGETDCSGCHSSPVNPDVPDLHFEFENNASQYQLDSSYLVHISIKKLGHTKFGFVCSALDSLNNSSGTFNLVNTTTTRTYTLGGRKYVSHTPCGADAQDSITWTYKWKAPTTDKGNIKIYMSMLVANHDEALTGDTTYTRVLQINSPLAASIENQNPNFSQTKVNPTVFSSTFAIDFAPAFNNQVKAISLFDMNGQLVLRNITKESNYRQGTENDLDPGIYILKVDYPNRTENFKLIKQ